MAGPDKSPLCWRFERWPEEDQAIWVLNCTSRDPFKKPRYGATLRPDTLMKIRKDYGRWLSFLHSCGWLDAAQSPLERVTRPRLRAYFRTLHRAGNADATIIGRFDGLALAMKILAPGQDSSWIRRPDGVTIYSILPKIRRTLMVPDAGVLIAWALKLMDRAESEPSPSMRLITYRDGLLLAMFAARSRRLKSMALLRVGHELVQRNGRYRIELTAEQVKTNKPDRFDLPDYLTPYVRHYLEVVRPALLDGRLHDALWIRQHGGPLTAKTIQEMTRKRAKKRFGQAFGPHRFRHALCTTAALRAPKHRGLGARVLGISARVVARNYDRAGQCQAAARYAELMERQAGG